MELNFLRNVLLDLRSRFDSKLSPSDCYLRRELLLLNDFEKRLIRKKVLAFDFNVGALKVLKLLKDCEILTMTDFLLNVGKEEELQAIIVDVFDTDDTYELLIEIIKASVSFEVIGAQFEISFRQYCEDCIERSNLIKKDFVGAIENQLPIDIYRSAVVTNLVEALLKYKNEGAVKVTEVIEKQKEWNNRFENESLCLLTQILLKVSINHSDTIVKRIIKELKTNFKLNWFFLFFIFKFIKDTTIVQNEIKHLLQSLFKKFLETQDLDHFAATIIIARQCYFFKADSSAYKNWVKNTIGQMSYNMKSQEKFTQMLDALQSIVFFESDEEILSVHAEVAIKAPHGLNHTVLEYKQIIRTKIASLSEPDVIMDLT